MSNFIFNFIRTWCVLSPPPEWQMASEGRKDGRPFRGRCVSETVFTSKWTYQGRPASCGSLSPTLPYRPPPAPTSIRQQHPGTDSRPSTPHLFCSRIKSSQFEAICITIFLQCATIKKFFDKIHYTNLCVSMINEAGQQDSQVHTPILLI